MADSLVSTWKAQLKQNNLATCPFCSLSFLSVSGVQNHLSKCAKTLSEGDFVSCSLCQAKFPQLKTLNNHIAKSHSPQSDQNITVIQKNQTNKAVAAGKTQNNNPPQQVTSNQKKFLHNNEIVKPMQPTIQQSTFSPVVSSDLSSMNHFDSLVQIKPENNFNSRPVTIRKNLIKKYKIINDLMFILQG